MVSFEKWRIKNVQLAPEQHRFELCWSTYMQIFFFNSKYYSMIHGWLNSQIQNCRYRETTHTEELCIQTAEYKLLCISEYVEGHS